MSIPLLLDCECGGVQSAYSGVQLSLGFVIALVIFSLPLTSNISSVAFRLALGLCCCRIFLALLLHLQHLLCYLYLVVLGRSIILVQPQSQAGPLLLSLGDGPFSLSLPSSGGRRTSNVLGIGLFLPSVLQGQLAVFFFLPELSWIFLCALGLRVCCRFRV